MDNQQQQRVNEAAQQFTDVLVAVYRATSDRTVATQQIGAQLAEYFFNAVINNLRTQAVNSRQITQQLVDQQQRAQEATRDLSRASTDTYLELLDSVFSFYPGGTSRPKGELKKLRGAKRRLTDELRKLRNVPKRLRGDLKRPKEVPRRLINEPRKPRGALRKPKKAPKRHRKVVVKPMARKVATCH